MARPTPTGHLVGAAELTRRLGPASVFLLETNEFRSWFADTRQWLSGAQRFPANAADARAMDRHNNAIGMAIGTTATTPEEVVERARQTIERARAWSGSGQGGTAYWMEQRRWTEPNPRPGNAPRDGSNWPGPTWPAIEGASHLRAYPGHTAKPAWRSNPEAKCPVAVAPHIRAGHPVRGYLRACPNAFVAPPG